MKRFCIICKRYKYIIITIVKHLQTNIHYKMNSNPDLSPDGADISPCKKFRYKLWRIWDKNKPIILFIMLNPSTADADPKNDDKTMIRVKNFAESWGYGGVYVGNLYAFRSKNPKVLKHIDDPIGPENIARVQSLVGLTDKVVYAWGNGYKEPKWLRDLVDTPYCIDISKKGNIPNHPSRLKKNLELKLYIRK